MITQPLSDFANQNLRAELDRLRAELAKAHEGANILVGYVNLHRNRQLKTEAELANARLERDTIAALNSSLIAELAEAKARIAELERKLALKATTERDINERSARIASLEAQLRHMHTFDGQHRARIAELEAALAHKTAAREVVGKLLLDADMKKAALGDLLAAKDVRIAELETDHLFAENNRLREACQEFRARAEHAEAALTAANADLVTVQNALASQHEFHKMTIENCDGLRNDWAAAVVRAEHAEAEADSLRSTIDNMRAMNIKLTWEATGKVLAAEAELKAMREALDRYRYSVSWIASDSWDWCADCKNHLVWARAMDPGSILTEDKLAEIGKGWVAWSGDKSRAALAPSPAGR